MQITTSSPQKTTTKNTKILKTPCKKTTSITQHFFPAEPPKFRRDLYLSMTKQKKQTRKQTTKPTPKKLRIGILFGGRSGEHEVSLLSAGSILKAIDRTKYEVIPIGITKQGQWLTSSDAQHLLLSEAKPVPVLAKTKSIQLN